MINSIIMAVIGGLIAFLGASALRRPPDETISVGEAVVLMATGAEPEPKSPFFKAFERLFHAFLTLIGLVLLTVGIGSLFWEF